MDLNYLFLGHMDSRLKFIFFLLLSLSSLAVATEPFKLTVSTSGSTDGSFNISWILPENKRIELQQSKQESPGFTTIYTGSDSATVITGMSDGNYLYRARLLNPDNQFPDDKQSSPWTDPLPVSVAHHSLDKAFGFFSVGAIVFIGTLLLIVFGYRTKKSGVNS